MANTTAPFVITTQLDMAGIEAGLSKLTTRLASYNASGGGATGGRTSTTGVPGNLDPKKIKGAETAVGGLNTRVTRGTRAIGRANLMTQQFNRTGHQTKNMLVDVGRRVFVWGSAAALIFGALQNMKEFYQVTIDVNTALAELKKVLPNETDFEALKGEGFSLAIEFGTDPLDVLKIRKRFGQSGLDAAESVEATRTALLGLNVTGAETEQIFNAIIGANKIFGVAFEDSGRIIDKVQAVQANFAVDYKDLIVSIQGIGPAITILGGDIDDLFANIAALAEAARVSGKEASNSLKRVFSRLISKEGIAALQEIGVKVHATADSFRPLRVILQDIGGKWEGLSQVQKANLSITLAQVRQYSKFAALIQNFEASQRALVISQEAVGDAFRANEHVMATFAKQSDVASNKLKALAEAAITSGGIARALTDLKIGFADFLDFLSGTGLDGVLLFTGALGGLIWAVKG